MLDKIRSLQEAPPGRDVSIVWDYPPVLPVIRSDGDKLRHIIQNLISNAVKFTPKGQIIISARLLPSGTLVVKVSDTGIGIPKDKLPIIFEMFRQVDSSQTRAYPGVGLGLYIVKRFAELLGGTVGIESEPGRGSTFSVEIPVSAKD